MGRSGRRARRVGSALIALAVLLVIGGVIIRVLAGRSASSSAETLTTPGEVTMDLGRGEHGIWVADDGALTLYDVTIEGPDGQIEYGPYGMFGSSATLRADGTSYRMDGDFEVTTAGSHTIRFEERPDLEGVDVDALDVAVGPDDDFAFPVATALAWLAAFVLVGIGALTAFIGLVMGLGSRRAQDPQAPPPPPPPPVARGQAF